MLTGEAYSAGLTAYLVSAVCGLYVLHSYVYGGLPRTLARLLTGILAGLLLAPALPGPEASTLAPALVVAVFNLLFGEGWESAQPAVIVLGMASAAGLLIAIGAHLLLGAVFDSGATTTRPQDHEKPL